MSSAPPRRLEPSELPPASPSPPGDQPLDGRGSRRGFLHAAGVGSVAFIAACGGSSTAMTSGVASPGASSGSEGEENEEGEKPVSATEDLGREHGVVDRVLLVYEECARRIGGHGEYDPKPLHDAATVARSFIEQYHEKLEEQHIFPRLEKANREGDLARLLRLQHDRGRALTDVVLAQTLPKTAPAVGSSDTGALVQAIDGYVRMYRPHSAREDTVLFPTFREVVSASELAQLGERFEDIEHQKFGPGGFENVVAQIAAIEKTLGIHDLAQYTP